MFSSFFLLMPEKAEGLAATYVFSTLTLSLKRKKVVCVVLVESVIFVLACLFFRAAFGIIEVLVNNVIFGLH